MPHVSRSNHSSGVRHFAAQSAVSSPFQGPFLRDSSTQFESPAEQPRIGATKLPIFVGGQLGWLPCRRDLSCVRRALPAICSTCPGRNLERAGHQTMSRRRGSRNESRSAWPAGADPKKLDGAIFFHSAAVLRLFIHAEPPGGPGVITRV